MQADYYVNLHFNQAVAQKTGYAFKIGDKGCIFHLHCEDLDPTGMLPHIVFNHPNNTCVEGVPDGSGRDYTYTVQGNEFGVCGKTVVDLKFYDNNNDATQRISTASFMIEIIPDTYTDFEESSSSYADSLERAREEIDAAILELQGAEHDLEEAETDLGNMSDQFADTLQDYIDAFGNTGPINPRGTYDDDTPYVPRDAVAYTAGGKTLTYINKQACTGIAPTDPDEGAAHWQIMIDVAVGGAFSALEDVSIDPQTLADGQVPVYNDTDDVWENKTILENSLTSTATDKALTAAQGKELQDNKQAKELETAITIDDASKTTVETALSGLNAYSDKLKGVLSNENLLVNPWFTVNQRGFLSGTASAYNQKYTVDMWKAGYNGTSGGSGVYTKTSNGMHLEPSGGSLRFFQIIEDPTAFDGKTLTFTVCYAQGTSTTFNYLSGTLANFDSSVGGQFISDSYLSVSYVPAYTAFMVFGTQECTIKAVKLEFGSISTLANDVAPDYTTELLKCQRYFFRLKANSAYTTFGFGFCTIADQLALPINLPVAMRPISAVNYAGIFRAYILGGSNKTVSAITLAASQVENMKLVYFTATGLTAGDICYLISENDSSAYIDLSADL